MKKLSKTETELKKSIAYKKSVYIRVRRFSNDDNKVLNGCFT